MLFLLLSPLLASTYSICHITLHLNVIIILILQKKKKQLRLTGVEKLAEDHTAMVQVAFKLQQSGSGSTGRILRWILVHCGSFSSPNTMIHLGGIWGCQVRAAKYGFPIAAPLPFHSGVIHLA